MTYSVFELFDKLILIKNSDTNHINSSSFNFQKAIINLLAIISRTSQSIPNKLVEKLVKIFK
jgi:hypothetical protein